MSDFSKSGNKVEIISDGVRELVFIDGIHLPSVVALRTPHEVGELSNQVRIEFIASEVHSRLVSTEEFEARKKGIR